MRVNTLKQNIFFDVDYLCWNRRGHWLHSVKEIKLLSTAKKNVYRAARLYCSYHTASVFSLETESWRFSISKWWSDVAPIIPDWWAVFQRSDSWQILVYHIWGFIRFLRCSRLSCFTVRLAWSKTPVQRNTIVARLWKATQLFSRCQKQKKCSHTHINAYWYKCSSWNWCEAIR